MITCASEMSGRASIGIWRSAQMPASTSRSVPVKRSSEDEETIAGA